MRESDVPSMSRKKSGVWRGRGKASKLSLILSCLRRAKKSFQRNELCFFSEEKHTKQVTEDCLFFSHVNNDIMDRHVWPIVPGQSCWC